MILDAMECPRHLRRMMADCVAPVSCLQTLGASTTVLAFETKPCLRLGELELLKHISRAVSRKYRGYLSDRHKWGFAPKRYVMGFYADISRYYDEIFPADAAEMAFVNRELQGRKRLLDIGCGTGNKTELLGTSDNEISGIDADPVMIELARAHHNRFNIKYAVLGMQDVGSLEPAIFDGILCLGNTLVHLNTHKAVQSLLDAVFALLRPDGAFIVQILHYEWVIAEHITSLPLTDTPNITFTRHYVWQGRELHFKTALLNKHAGIRHENDIVLLPLLTSELAEMLKTAGFTDIRQFGSYRGAPLEQNSPASITVCRRP